MAIQNNNESEEVKVRERLKAITRLQEALSRIDRIQTLRGELPLEVQNIEDSLMGLETRLENLSASAKTQMQMVSNEKTRMASSKELLAKYRKQIDNVRNNLEYDSLSKEIEYQELEIQLSEKRIREGNQNLAHCKEQIAAIKEQHELRSGDLAAKRAELDQIIKETQEEEERLTKEAAACEAQISDERLLNAFHRIRNGSRNGLAVVPIDRDACGGCFNRIPPQTQLEVRLAKKIIVCEYCGRIIVDPDLLVDPVEAAAQAEEEQSAAKPKKKAAAKKTTKKATSSKASTRKKAEPQEE